MKKIFLVPLVALSIVSLVSCMKDKTPSCTDNSLTQDRQVIDSFITASPSLNYVTFNSTFNIYMGIENPGTGSMPAADSQIVFKRESRLLSGTLLDSATISITQQGFPLKLSDYNSTSVDYAIFTQLKEGGAMKLIIPSSLNGLGCQSGNWRYASSPANSQIITTISLIDVKRSQ